MWEGLHKKRGPHWRAVCIFGVGVRVVAKEMIYQRGYGAGAESGQMRRYSPGEQVRGAENPGTPSKAERTWILWKLHTVEYVQSLGCQEGGSKRQDWPQGQIMEADYMSSTKSQDLVLLAVRNYWHFKGNVMTRFTSTRQNPWTGQRMDD